MSLLWKIFAHPHETRCLDSIGCNSCNSSKVLRRCIIRHNVDRSTLHLQHWWSSALECGYCSGSWFYPCAYEDLHAPLRPLDPPACLSAASTFERNAVSRSKIAWSVLLPVVNIDPSDLFFATSFISLPAHTRERH